MNQPVDSDRVPTDTERVRWVMLGFGKPDDLSDMSEERIQAAKGELVSTASAFAKSGLRQPLARSYGWVKTIALTACTCLLFFGLFVSIQNAFASQQAIAGNEYAQKLVRFSLDLFEEDLGVISDQAARSDVLLPEPMFWSVDRFTQKRMHACPQAIQALTSVRMGFPEAGAYQLESIPPLLFNDGSYWATDSRAGDVQRDLELIFHLTAGKALFESLQTTIGRSYLTKHSRDFSQLANSSYQSLQHALGMIQEQPFDSLSLNDEKVLMAAIEIDLARARLKFGRLVVDDKTKTDFELKEAVRLDLELIKSELSAPGVRDVRCLIQSARCLNNEILAMEQKHALGPLTTGREMRQLLDAKIDEIGALLGEIDSIEGAAMVPALNFEIAICYSNLADLLRGTWNMSKLPEQHAFTEERDMLRRKAADLFAKVPRVNRTERHFENMVTNEARQIQTEYVSGVLANPDYTPSPKLRSKATNLSMLLGEVLGEGDVGQVPVESRIAIALIIPQLYPIEDLKEFADQVPDVSHCRSRVLLKKLVSEKSKALQKQ